jgi:hypothetical protein
MILRDETQSATQGTASAQSTIQKIGNTYYHSDGNTTQKIGNTYYHSDPY